MLSPEDEPLLRDLAAGKEQAFSALYERFGGRLYRFALRMLRRPEDAEDAVQEVFAALVRGRERLIGVQNLTAYLFTALRREAGRCGVRRGRQASASQALIDGAAETRGRVDSPNQQSELLETALKRLPEEQREVIALKIDGELTFAEIARVQEISINTAMSRYRYALEKLRASLVE